MTKKDSMRGCTTVGILVEAKKDFGDQIIKGGIYRVSSINWDSNGFQYNVKVKSISGFNYLPSEWFNVVGGFNVVE